MKTIPLTQGKVTIVDDADYEWLSQWRWHVVNNSGIYYAARRPHVRMHRVILNVPHGVDVDHINRDGLDNRRSNLRKCNHRENIRNQGLHRNSSTGFKGVRLMKQAPKKRYYVQIGVDGKDIHVGCYGTAKEAAQAYDAAALKHHGDFALTNKMLGLL